MNKKLCLFVFISLALVGGVQAVDSRDGEDLRSQASFVETCPEEFLTYIDKSEGGPGAYCDCPEDNISYIDRSEGGPGFYCSDL